MNYPFWPWLAVILTPLISMGAPLQLALPLGRTAYQCNESIPVSVLGLRSAAGAPGEFVLNLASQDGSRLGFTFALPSLRPAQSHAAEHFRINGWLLRPGVYSLEIACGNRSARTNLTLLSAVRRSDFKLINWRQNKDKDQLAQGEESLGFNVCYANYGGDDQEGFLRAGVDIASCCVMGGGHQMDLRPECDWSDPYVISGGTRRAVRRAFIDRTWPNVMGVHFYDEPGLTWGKDPQTGEATPHTVPWQWRQYEAAFERPQLDWKTVDPADPQQAGRWIDWARWKLDFLDAAWHDAQFGVSTVEPRFLSLTESQYGYGAFSDGYYFNVVRSLPVISGHGGYHDFGPGYFNPVMFLEFARARDLAKPNWYLPTWYGSTTADLFRLEQYLCFQCDIQGLMSPPDIDPGAAPEKSLAAQGVVEANQLVQRLGPVFNNMPVTRPPVALLFSLSQFLHAQTIDRKVCYAHQTAHGRNVQFSYLAGKLLQLQFMPVLDEDVRDGTLAANHKAILLTSLDYLDPDVIAGLEQFARQGGLVLATADTAVHVAGAVKLKISPEWPDAKRINELTQDHQTDAANKLMQMRQELAGAWTLAGALRPYLEQAGIRPPLSSSEPGIVVTRQAAGDVEYLLAVNATHDLEGDPMLGLKSVDATLTLPNDGRPVYDAVHAVPATAFEGRGTSLRGNLRFGPGQMRVFARTAHPIGSVSVGTPTLRRDYTLAQAPLRLDLSAAVLDDQSRLLGGSIPLEISLTDPLGTIRYDLYRATVCGSLSLGLPLALNDPPGDWTISVTELLNHRQGVASFRVACPATGAAAVGAVRRAIYWPSDAGNVFRFFREHHQVTLIKGRSDFNAAAATRLEKILKPWNITCSIISAVEANQARSLNADEARTWIGLEPAGQGAIQPGSSNSPALVGYAVAGPVILLGTPADNPLIKFVADQHFLPFNADAESMPGPERGFLAWQRDALGARQESITLIAIDSPGMDEAVGTLYELLAGLEPLSPLAMPLSSTVAPATNPCQPKLLPLSWTVALPDRITAVHADLRQLTVLTHDGSLSEITPEGKLLSTRTLAADQYSKLLAQFQSPPDPEALAAARKVTPPTRLLKIAAPRGDRIALAWWGGTVGVIDSLGAVQAARRLPQDVTVLAWLNTRLIAGDADGNLIALGPLEPR